VTGRGAGVEEYSMPSAAANECEHTCEWGYGSYEMDKREVSVKMVKMAMVRR
jgi:hypothetical protein